MSNIDTLPKNRLRKIKFTNKELIWIERTADIESALLLNRFFQLVNTDLTNKSEQEKEMLKRMGTELIDTYIFLKDLRLKLEIWDARYDVDTEIVEEIKDDKKAVGK